MPHSTQYRSYRRRSSQPITWLILTNKTVQENTDKQTQFQPENVDNLKYSKTKLPWFSYLLQHSARKRGGLILQRRQAQTGLKYKKKAPKARADSDKAVIIADGTVPYVLVHLQHTQCQAQGLNLRCSIPGGKITTKLPPKNSWKLNNEDAIHRKVDKGCLMNRMGVSGWMFLLVPGYLGSPGQRAV